MQEWLDKKISTVLKPILDDIEETISSEVRSILFNVYNSLGTMLINEHNSTIKNLTEHEKIIVSRSWYSYWSKIFFYAQPVKKITNAVKCIVVESIL